MFIYKRVNAKNSIEHPVSPQERWQSIGNKARSPPEKQQQTTAKNPNCPKLAGIIAIYKRYISTKQLIYMPPHQDYSVHPVPRSSNVAMQRPKRLSCRFVKQQILIQLGAINAKTAQMAVLTFMAHPSGLLGLSCPRPSGQLALFKNAPGVFVEGGSNLWVPQNKQPPAGGFLFWRTHQDSNLRPLPPEGGEHFAKIKIISIYHTLILIAASIKAKRSRQFKPITHIFGHFYF